MDSLSPAFPAFAPEDEKPPPPHRSIRLKCATPPLRTTAADLESRGRKGLSPVIKATRLEAAQPGPNAMHSPMSPLDSQKMRPTTPGRNKATQRPARSP